MTSNSGYLTFGKSPNFRVDVQHFLRISPFYIPNEITPAYFLFFFLWCICSTLYISKCTLRGRVEKETKQASKTMNPQHYTNSATGLWIILTPEIFAQKLVKCVSHSRKTCNLRQSSKTSCMRLFFCSEGTIVQL